MKNWLNKNLWLCNIVVGWFGNKCDINKRVVLLFVGFDFIFLKVGFNKFGYFKVLIIVFKEKFNVWRNNVIGILCKLLICVKIIFFLLVLKCNYDLYVDKKLIKCVWFFCLLNCVFK